MSLHPFTEAMQAEAFRQARRFRATIDRTELGSIVMLEAFAPQGELWTFNNRPCIEFREPETGAVYSLLIRAMSKGTYRPE